MKKITLNDTDLDKIVKRVLNEQEDSQFDEDEINFLYWIFERELKPPFSKSEMNKYGDYPYPYFNRDGEHIGWLGSYNQFVLLGSPFWHNIKYKVCQVFEFSRETADWWNAIEPHLRSWMESQLNIEIRNIE